MGGGAGIMIGRSRSSEESVDEYTVWQTYITWLVLVFRLDIDYSYTLVYQATAVYDNYHF
jgi:hypothetical protein